MKVAVVGGGGTIGRLLVARLAADGDEVRVLSRTAPTRLPQGAITHLSVDPEAVAERLAEIVHAGPGGRAPDIAGPELLTLGQMAHHWREAAGRRLLPLRVPIVGKALRAIQAGGLCDPEHPGPGRSFEQWLAQR